MISVLVVRSALPDTLSRLQPRQKQLLAFAAVAGAFPDIDYFSALVDPLSFIADWHRGPTHSLVMIPIWAILLAGIASRFSKAQHAFFSFTLVAVIVLFCHILSDTITTWGTQILWPFSGYKASLETSFVIDPIMTGLVLFPLLVALYWNKKSIALLGVLLLISYIGTQAFIKAQVEKYAETYATNQQITNAHITSLPQPMAPFNWNLIINDGENYHMARLSLMLDAPTSTFAESAGFLNLLLSHYHPLDNLQWEVIFPFGQDSETSGFAKDALQQPEFSRFRRFAKLPVLVDVEKKTEETCAWFADLRFNLTIAKNPFIYGMCLSPNGSWQQK